MKTKAKKSVICALLALFLSVCVLFGVSLTKRNEKAQAATGNSVTLTIQSNNLSYSDCIYMLYAVSVEGVDFTQNPIKMLFWESAKASQDEYAFGTQAYSVTSNGTTTVTQMVMLHIHYNSYFEFWRVFSPLFLCFFHQKMRGYLFATFSQKYATIKYC